MKTSLNGKEKLRNYRPKPIQMNTKEQGIEPLTRFHCCIVSTTANAPQYN